MSTGLISLAIAIAAVAFSLIIYEVHLRALDARVSNVVMGISERSASFQGVTVWLASLGIRYRRFYSADDLEQLRLVIQSAGFNPHRTVPIWIGVKVVSMALFPLLALFLAEIFEKSSADLLVFVAIGAVIGIMGPRAILGWLRRRFTAAVRKGTPNAIDLLVICSEAGLGLESALERVAEEMKRSNPAMALVFYGLLDDLRILPNRRDAFEKLGSASDGLRRFGAMISQSLQFGTPLGQALRAIADELRRESLIKLEERAHKLGAKLTIPMVLFLLPAMFVILGGASFLHLARAFDNLH